MYTKQKPTIEEGVRPMLQSEELNNLSTEENVKLVTKY